MIVQEDGGFEPVLEHFAVHQEMCFDEGDRLGKLLMFEVALVDSLYALIRGMFILLIEKECVDVWESRCHCMGKLITIQKVYFQALNFNK